MANDTLGKNDAASLDVAWDHIQWARRHGMTPQDVIEGCGATAQPEHGWEFATRLVEALFTINGRKPVARRSSVERAPRSLAPMPLRGPPIPPKPKLRTCIRGGCDTVFLSTGNGHRMCAKHTGQVDPLPAGWETTEPLGDF